MSVISLAPNQMWKQKISSRTTQDCASEFLNESFTRHYMVGITSQTSSPLSQSPEVWIFHGKQFKKQCRGFVARREELSLSKKRNSTAFKLSLITRSNRSRLVRSMMSSR